MALAFVDKIRLRRPPCRRPSPSSNRSSKTSPKASKSRPRHSGRQPFPDGGREGGTNVVISSIVVNDNVIDLIATPGAKAGDPVFLAVSPKTTYATFVNHLTTSVAGAKPEIQDPVTVTNPDGSVTVTLAGSLPAASHPFTAPYAVPSPTNFAQTVLSESLVSAGIQIKAPRNAATPDFKTLSHFYVPDYQVAEHVSLRFPKKSRSPSKSAKIFTPAWGPIFSAH
jgi:D-alanyl-D-alanine carboxypeptidase